MTFDDQPGFRGAGGPVAPSTPPSYPAAAPGAGSPATLAPDLSFAGSVGTAVGHRSRDRYKPRFSYQSRSPLPHLVVVLVLLGLVVFATVNIDSSALDQSTDVIDTSTGQLAGSGDVGDDDAMVWLGVLAILGTFVAVCVLIGRIGANVRGTVSSFGAWTAAVALPAWHVWLLNRLDVYGVDSYGSLMATYVTCFVLALIGYCILQARLFSRLWEAGGFGGERWSPVLWAPPALGWLTLYASAIFTLVSVGEDGGGTSRWVPTERMGLFTDGAVVGSLLGLLALLIAVSVAQHRGIRADRAALHAERTKADQPIV